MLIIKDFTKKGLPANGPASSPAVKQADSAKPDLAEPLQSAADASDEAGPSQAGQSQLPLDTETGTSNSIEEPPAVDESSLPDPALSTSDLKYWERPLLAQFDSSAAGQLCQRLGGRLVGESYMANCPAHPDRDPSLAITEKDGKLLVHCHAGCTQAAVIEALRDQGLWKSGDSSGSGGSTKLERIVRTYEYTDTGGQMLYQIVRYEPKNFRQRYPDSAGGWIWRKYPDQVLYRRHEVVRATCPIFVVEGEKDVETLRDHSFCATTNAGGAEAPWLPSYTEDLAGRDIVIIPDSDPAGLRRALRIARALVGVARNLTILELDSKDVSAWFESGHSAAELVARLQGGGGE